MKNSRTLLWTVICWAMLAGFWPGAWAQAPSDDYSAMETQLFSRSFETEPEAARLKRLEQVLFGSPQSGGLALRKDTLMSLWRENGVMPLAENTQPAPEAQAQVPESPPANQDATDYPAVSALEQKVFQQSYAQEDIQQRLRRLEQSVFRQTYDELPMVDRVDQLSLKINPDSSLGREESLSAQPWGKGLPSNGSQLSSSGPAIYSRITGLEEQVLGRSYGGELLSSRLSRLEQTMFGSPQGGSIDSRLDRLILQYGRQTAQNRAPMNPSPQVQPPQFYTPPQPMLGAGQGMNYSQDMLNALPPALRQKMEFQQQGAPVYVQPQQQPPVYQPPQAQANMAAPNAAIQKSLTILEYQVFGRDYTTYPMSTRLDNLERQVFGRTYPLMPYNQRVGRLLMRSGGKQGATALDKSLTPNMLMMMPQAGSQRQGPNK